MSRFDRWVAGRLLAGLVVVIGLAIGMPEARAQDKKFVEFDLPAQSLEAALQQVADKLKLQLLYTSGDLRGLSTKGLKGRFSTKEAIERLLDGTGLVASFDGGSAVAIRPTAEGRRQNSQGGTSARAPMLLAQSPTSPRNTDLKQDQGDQTSLKKGEEIVVTGTRIRGVTPSSHVLSISQEEMRLSGHNNLGEVIRSVPQNFSGGQNPGVGGVATVTNPTSRDFTGGSSFNLRGLGPDATLTLLNGTRLPYSGLFQAIDVSVIPIAAIERVEVLLDGASAIYGSDAVAGVANIILKRDYQGAEFSARYGLATDGGYKQSQFTGIAGTAWNAGGFLVTADVARTGAVLASDRDYLSYMPSQNATIFPGSTQKGALLSGHQGLGRLGEFTLDTFYTERKQELLVPGSATLAIRNNPHAVIWGVAPAVRIPLPNRWSLRLHGFVGRDDVEFENRLLSVPAGNTTGLQLFQILNEADVVGAESEGPLFSLPGGDARFSLGGGRRGLDFLFKTTNPVSGLVTGQTQGHDRNHYAYGEVNLPFVSERLAVPHVARLSFNGAIRYDEYEAFSGTTGKVGALWEVTRGLQFRASGGKSFKAPTLQQRFTPPDLQLWGPSLGGIPAGRTIILIQGGNPDLAPETAKVMTAGLVFQPEALRDVSIEVNWFDIDYVNRVLSNPLNPIGQALTNPAFADFVTLNPTVAQQNAAFAAVGLPVGVFTFNRSGVPYDPSNVVAIYRNFAANASAQRARGVDLAASYHTEIGGGGLSINGNASWLRSNIRLTSRSPELDRSGVIYFSPKFRARIGARWARGGFTFSPTINHISGVRNTNFTPNPNVSSMTTLDLVLNYRTSYRVIGDASFNIAIANLFNRRPPFMQPQFAPVTINYDPTNYSALGRTVSITVTKRF